MSKRRGDVASLEVVAIIDYVVWLTRTDSFTHRNEQKAYGCLDDASEYDKYGFELLSDWLFDANNRMRFSRQWLPQ